ncbi:SCP2 domain-containing protein [Massilia sp. TS11]|uniref:ubiquinone anaerobic biosynthesis accessory factor UbiT n=1 Tax=Massilia sp. TS11 TaxID=2908003 RepID=UPI001EDC2281|nr:SCP2 sterol-binding domain-containing protein [Massilia sp. TS11]MCG2585938.1 SCP2 sterol-binding domain-containing protein [Massilia sp. TS11]
MTVPSPVAGLLAKLPPLPGAWLFAQGLNLALTPQLPEDVKPLLEGRPLRLRVNDAGLAFDFCWRGRGFVGLARQDAPHLTIGASLHDLVRLARREEDPDTLFFSRRLVLEGDTELGLLFKNTLDALETWPFDPAHFAPRRVLRQLLRQTD